MKKNPVHLLLWIMMFLHLSKYFYLSHYLTSKSVFRYFIIVLAHPESEMVEIFKSTDLPKGKSSQSNSLQGCDLYMSFFLLISMNLSPNYLCCKFTIKALLLDISATPSPGKNFRLPTRFV